MREEWRGPTMMITIMFRIQNELQYNIIQTRFIKHPILLCSYAMPTPTPMLMLYAYAYDYATLRSKECRTSIQGYHR